MKNNINFVQVGREYSSKKKEIKPSRLDLPSTESTRGNPVLQKMVTLRNTGNMKAIIHDISFGQSKCIGHGFSANVCNDIEIEPNDRYDLRIR